MANLSVEEPDALMCARPDLWEPRVATPGATRPGVGNASASLSAAFPTDAPFDTRHSGQAIVSARRRFDDRCPCQTLFPADTINQWL